MRHLWLVVLGFCVGASAASAHPLGNFTVNRYAALQPSARTVAVHYVLDLAEIPAYQEIETIDANHDGTIAASERDAYLARAPLELARGLALALDGETLLLTPSASRLELPTGAGGLPTLRLEADYEAALPRPTGTLAFRDDNFAGRPGWREVIAQAGPGVALGDTSVPQTDRSQALRSYPPDLLQSPPQVSEAHLRLVAGGSGSVASTRTRAAAGVGAERFADRLTELVANRTPLTPGLVVLSLLVAAGLGALHALSPGHGKTVVGAYLVGARGTARHALFLGLVVTATHTLGVYLLGFTTLAASEYVLPERLFLWMSLVSGMLVVAIGASLATSRLNAALGIAAGDGRHRHHHGDGGHDHGHDPHHHNGHDHAHDHGHTHLPVAADGSPLSWRSLLALGVSGGLLPCPSALVVMLGAISLGRVGFGLLLIVAFSAGLAVVLTAIGLALVYSRDLFKRLPLDGRFASLVPVASALVIMVAGLAMVAQALAQAGMLHLWT